MKRSFKIHLMSFCRLFLSKVITLVGLLLPFSVYANDHFRVYRCHSVLSATPKEIDVLQGLEQGRILEKYTVGDEHKTEAFRVVLDNGLQAIVKPKDETIFSNPKHELLAYHIDRYFGFNLIPPTIMVNYKGKEASLQYFLKYPTASTSYYEVLGLALYKQVLFDFIINNWDRHEGNYLVINREELISIDHGGAFEGHGLLKPKPEYYKITIKKYLITPEG